MLAESNAALLSRISLTPRTGAELPLAVSPRVDALLAEIHSETTVNERRFLYQFFSTLWSGENSVIEIGPFLGGTTRAIALGMGDNPRVTPDARLLTFDRFSQYYDMDSLRNAVQPLVENGVLRRSDLDAIGERAEFMDLFVKLHQPHHYFARVIARNLPVPDRSWEEGAESFAISDDIVSDAVFIDGCKSWFGTKFAMRALAAAVRPGSYFIFQDYGHYSCFWISAFVGIFSDHFRLVSFVDDTYTFVLVAPLLVEEINSRFPDTPSGFTDRELEKMFDRLSQEARARNDDFAVLRHAMHKAAALAYIGNKASAKAILNDLAANSPPESQYGVIQQALISPTYTPDGDVLLDE